MLAGVDRRCSPKHRKGMRLPSPALKASSVVPGWPRGLLTSIIPDTAIIATCIHFSKYDGATFLCVMDIKNLKRRGGMKIQTHLRLDRYPSQGRCTLQNRITCLSCGGCKDTTNYPKVTHHCKNKHRVQHDPIFLGWVLSPSNQPP